MQNCVGQQLEHPLIPTHWNLFSHTKRPFYANQAFYKRQTFYKNDHFYKTTTFYKNETTIYKTKNETETYIYLLTIVFIN